MKFLSVCSGIEAASVAWSPLGWKAVAFSEIEPFPCAVLAHHYPDTPNWGDMTKYKEWPDVSIDLLCGGTPCQSFSVAGLRKGLDDPRGNLMLTFGAIAAKYKPNWIMWENVPGVLSSNGGNDFRSFLDMLEELGYVCDIEILDAQYFGVAQRRRRVFVCGQHRNDLLSQRTDTSALTITQCLQEILQAILIEGCSRSGSAPANSDSPSLSKDGAIRRMRLFGLDGASECWPMLRENLTAAFQRCQQGQKHSDAHPGESEKELTQAGQLTGLQAENLSTLTEKSLKNALDEAFAVMKLFTTSTVTSSITPAQIFSCSKAALLIAKLTRRLNQSSPAFWSSALSSLTAVEEFINYARSTSSDLFGDLERVQAWLDFIEQAEHTSESFLDIGIECFGEIFPLPDCLQGHTAPRREAGQGSAAGTLRSTQGGSDVDHARAGHLAFGGNNTRGPIDIATALNASASASASGRMDFESETFIAHSLRGEGFDASEDGTGRGTPLVPVGVTIHGTDPTVQKVASLDETAQCLRARTPGNIDNSSTTVVMQPVAFAENTRAEVRLEGGDGTRTGALSTGGGKPGQGIPCVAYGIRTANTSSNGWGIQEEVTHTLDCAQGVAVAVALRGREGGATAELGDEVQNCLRASSGGGDKPYVLCEALYNKGFNHESTYASTQETNAGKILRALREAVGEEAFAKWGLGILDSLQSPEILRQALHGFSIRPAAFSRSWVVYCALSRQEDGSGWLLQSLREAECERCSSPGWEPPEQLARELGAYLSELSRPGAQASRFVRDLWWAAQGPGLLREALSAVQEVGRPTHGQRKPVHAGAEGFGAAGAEGLQGAGLHREIPRDGVLQQACAASEAGYSGCSATEQERGGQSRLGQTPFEVRRLTCEEAEFLQGFPRGYTNVPHRNKPAADGPRYKALGNSWAVPCARWIGERIEAVEAIK